MPAIFKLTRTLRFLGLIPLIIGCCLDFDGWLHIGLIVRFTFGILGAYLLLGALDSDGAGWMGTLIGGLLIYLFSIRSGAIQMFTFPCFDFPFVLEGWPKIIVRVISVVSFILGFKDTYQHRPLNDR